MNARKWVSAIWLCLALSAQSSAADPQPAQPGVCAAVYRLTLEEAKERVLANSKALRLATLNAQGKGYAIRAARADYFPKIIGFSVYAHFDNPLGTVLTTPGIPLLGRTPTAITANVLNQDSSLSTVAVAQPITDLLKVRQGVKIAQADERIAQTQIEKGKRALLSGVEQLYWGLLAAQRIRSAATVAVAATEALAQTQTIEARTAFLEAKQALFSVESQVADLQEQLNNLLDLPACAKLELIEPPFPAAPVNCVEDAIGLTLAASPEVRSAEQDIVKARAAVAAAKVDYLPSLAVVGGYAKQTGASYIQQDINYISVVGTYTFFDWGKRKNVLCERNNLVVLAQTKFAQTQEEVRQSARKAFREFVQSQEALQNAAEMVQLRKEAEKSAVLPASRFAAAKAEGLAEVEYVKADLAYRTAYVQLISLLGRE